IPEQWSELILQGISTHHAGLLPVFKSFVEELFAKALVKVVFATETLAAGINMPARSTVITTLSKRIDTGIVKLEPSQILQMGGRAGRRGLDSMGSVVLMRSKFEDVIEAHRLLLSPLNGIQSHFRSSYSMVAGILRSKDMESAKIIVEKSFGSFLRKKHIGPVQVAANEAKKKLDAISRKLQGVGLSDAKFYRKLWERLRGEEGILAFLKAQERESEEEAIRAILPLARLGSGLLLSDDRTAAFLGEYMSGGGAEHDPDASVDPGELYMVIDQQGRVEALPVSEFRFVDGDTDAGISAAVAMEVESFISACNANPWNYNNHTFQPRKLAETLGKSSLWVPKILASQYPRQTNANTAVHQIGHQIGHCIKLGVGLVPASTDLGLMDPTMVYDATSSMPTMELPPIPGHIMRQLSVIERVKEQMRSHPVHELPHVKEVVELSKGIIDLEDKVRTGWKAEQKMKQPAWDEFIACCRSKHRINTPNSEIINYHLEASFSFDKYPSPNPRSNSRSNPPFLSRRVLTLYGALEGTPENPNPTGFGELVASINAENELWMALVLTHPNIVTLGHTELAGLMPAIINEGTRADTFSLYGASEVRWGFCAQW
ncbi:unnamed protein product, partial [Discosporangium mesarthrocarpum]